MAEKFIRIVNWDRFQHYKDRNPPWIKLHRELLQSHTWVTGDDASRALAIACMLLAAATENKIPADPAYLRRVAYLNSEPDLSHLLSTQFVEMIDENGGASTALARCLQVARPETEAETETEKKKHVRAENPRAAVRFTPPTLEEINAYCQERRNGVNPQQFIDHYTANGWRVGRNPMKDWKAAIRTWEAKNQLGSRRAPDAHMVQMPTHAPCPIGFCDGSGWFVDPVTRKRSDCECAARIRVGEASI
jgi:hypothetical protein